MSPLFPPWTNSVFALALAAGVGSVVLGPIAWMVWVRTPYVTDALDPPDQPVEFDHRHHVRDDGIGCLYCHWEATRSPYAGVPPTELCMGCHAQIWNESPLLEPVRRSWFTGRPIPWNRVHFLPEFVYFDHSIHVNRGVDCSACHGRVQDMPRVYAVAPLTMGWCLECHRRPEPHLRPPEHVADLGWEPPATGPAQLALGRELKDRLRIDPPTNCTACHR